MGHNSGALACKLKFAQTCGNEHAVALFKLNCIVALGGKHTAAVKNKNVYERGLVCLESSGGINIDNVNGKIFALCKTLLCPAAHVNRFGLRIRLCGAEVCNVNSLVDVELSGLAVCAYSAVIVDTVGGVGILLYLSDKDTLAYGVESSCLDEENVALLYGNGVCNFKQSIVFYSLTEFFLCDIMLEAVEQGSTLVAVNDIPHLGLAVFALNSLSILIVGVNLNGKVILSVDKLYKNRE